MSGRFLYLASALIVLTAFNAARAETLRPADLAWIQNCIDDRAEAKLDPAKLRVYCACMQETVEDNEPFTVTGLERSYPPAHIWCKEEAGMLRR